MWRLDAVKIGKKAKLPNAPVMIYGDDVTHVVTEQGIAYLYMTDDMEKRRKALQAIAGVTPLAGESQRRNRQSETRGYCGMASGSGDSGDRCQTESSGCTEHGSAGPVVRRIV